MVHAEPFELRAHAFEHPIDRAFGAGGQLTDLYSPKTLQAELDYLSLGVAESRQYLLNSFREDGRLVRCGLAGDCFPASARVVALRSMIDFTANVTAGRIKLFDAVTAFPECYRRQKAPKVFPALRLKLTFLLAQEKAFVSGLQDILRIDLVPDHLP